MPLGYRGKTNTIPSIVGGWNANPNIDEIPPTSLVDIRNINLHLGGRKTRGGIDKVNGTVITDAVIVTGGCRFRLENGNEFIVTATTDGKIQKDYNTELKTGLSTGKYSMFETFNELLYVCNGADRPQTWDGTANATTNLISVTSDWTGTNWPKHILKHGKGISESLWAYGCPSNLKRIYISKNGTDDFSDAEVTKIDIETGDGFGIVAAVEYGDNMFCFGKRKTYIIDDSSATRTNWGYEDAQWDGGAAHERAICKTLNELIVFDENLEIYSVTATLKYGDYQAASIARPAWINKWIDDNVNKAQINLFHIIYDKDLRAIKLFVVRKGQTQIDTVLVFFIDKGPENGWVQHRYTSDRFAACSFPVRVAAGNWKIYTGGIDGFVYQLETTTYNDDGSAYYNGWTTPYLGFESSRIKKHYNRGWLTVIPQATETIKIKVTIDGVPVLGAFILADENGNYIGDESDNPLYTNTEELHNITASTSSTLQNLDYRIGKTGNRIQTEVYNETVNTSFFTAQQMFDYELLESDIS